MATFRSLLPNKLFEVVERAGISTPKQIIVLSVWDIKKRTNLRTDDIMLLKDVAADLLAPQTETCDKMITQNKVTTGCPAVDNLLNGGFRKGTLTEIYGESGSGKTQIAIQATAHSWPNGGVYICTEDLFPVKRFEQIKQSLPCYSPDNDYGKNIFVEHITEAQELLSCIRVRLRKLLDKNNLSLIVIDSVAAPFRSEYTNYITRAEELRELAMALLAIAQEYNLAVLCINQVTASFKGDQNVIPSLGLAWSNMVATRLWLKKTTETVDVRNILLPNEQMQYNKQETLQIRELSVIFAPDLPNSIVKLIITPTGIQSI